MILITRHTIGGRDITVNELDGVLLATCEKDGWFFHAQQTDAGVQHFTQNGGTHPVDEPTPVVPPDVESALRQAFDAHRATQQTGGG